jgi:hypothetical protein
MYLRSSFGCILVYATGSILVRSRQGDEVVAPMPLKRLEAAIGVCQATNHSGEPCAAKE